MDNSFQNFNSYPDLKRYNQFLIPIFLVFLFTVIGYQCYYKIEPSELGVIQRFGKHVRTERPGPHLKLPFGIETVKKVKVTVPFREEFGFSSGKENHSSLYGRVQRFSLSSLSQKRMWSNQSFNEKVGFSNRDRFLAESLMLTGDLNFADVNWIIQYKIVEPTKYLFNVKNVGETIRVMSESIMREVVGDVPIDDVLTTGKAKIQAQAKDELQKVMDEYQCGVKITQLAFQDVNPPSEVKGAFEEVNKAEQEKKKTIDQAWANYNKIIPKAKGTAEKIIRQAEGYAIDRINRAKGDAERFNLTYKFYKDAKDVTRRRLYLEALGEMIPSLKEVVLVDSELKGVLPLLDLSGKSEEGGVK